MKTFSIKTNDDYTFAFYCDGDKVIDSLEIDEGLRLRDILTKNLSGAKYEQALCRRQWKKTVAENYKIGGGQPIRIQNGVEPGEHFICFLTGKRNKPMLQYTVEGYINQLAEKDRLKARDVFAKWL